MENININLKQAALEYAEQGIPVFPLWHDTKAPITKNGFKDATTDLSVINGWWTSNPKANIGIPTGEVSGLFVVDVDVKNGASGNKTIERLISENGGLNETRTHITPSGGYHLLFKSPGFEVRNSAGKVGPGVDVRCDGGYIVTPPSIIDGNYYKVLNQCVSVTDAPKWLIELASVPSKQEATEEQVSQGQRNNHIFKTAMDSKRQGLAYEDAQKVVAEANMECNPPLGDAEVMRTLDSAYRYDVDTIPPEILEMNKRHAVVMVGGKCRILKEITCPVFNWPDIELSSPTDFKQFYCNKYIKVDEKTKPLGDTWFSDPARRQYEGLVFAPGHAPSNYYNLWRGFAVDPIKGDCSLFLKHIEENIADGNKEVYDYIIGWMANAVQHPDELVGTVIVLRGSMGVGKGVFANGFGSLFGRHYLPLNQSSQLTGKFNAHMKDVVVLLADEAFWAGDKAAEGVLKGLITEPFLVIEGKGDNAFKMKNHLHMIFATNNDWAVPAGPEERRFFVLDVGDKHKQDHQYFEAITKELDNGGRQALLHYLMNYDVSDTNLRIFPQTKALLETKLMSLTPAQKFWFHKLESGCLANQVGWNGGQIETSDLHDQYIQFVANLGIKHKASDNELGMQLKKMLPSDKFDKKKVTSSGYRRYCYIFPALDECRAYFDEFINYKIEWPTEIQDN